MERLALLSMRDWKPGGAVEPPIRMSGISRSVLGPLMEVFWIPPDATPSPLRHRRTAWLPDLQVLVARESEIAARGLVVAAKGGHNAESHNHNDVGHFMVYLDGSPGIIDIGRETYTRTTFSSDRYSLWFTRGDGHNAPVVGGVEQPPGRQYRATEVTFRETPDSVSLGLRLDAAYPPSAGLVSLRRDFLFQRGEDAQLAVRDSYETREEATPLSVTLYCVGAPSEASRGRITIPCGTRPLLLHYDPVALGVVIDPVELSDPKLREAWGERIHRIRLETRSREREGNYTLTFRAGEA
jgi:hypothetical protein